MKISNGQSRFKQIVTRHTLRRCYISQDGSKSADAQGVMQRDSDVMLRWLLGCQSHMAASLPCA